MAIEAETLRTALLASFADATIEIEDLVGDQDHYSVVITSAQFQGKSLVAQHKMVNDALKFCLGGQLHALKIKTIIKKEE
jgi:stress-induced morphogen